MLHNFYYIQAHHTKLSIRFSLVCYFIRICVASLKMLVLQQKALDKQIFYNLLYYINQPKAEKTYDR